MSNEGVVTMDTSLLRRWKAENEPMETIDTKITSPRHNNRINAIITLYILSSILRSKQILVTSRSFHLIYTESGCTQIDHFLCLVS
jgi:hypothetical protein